MESHPPRAPTPPTGHLVANAVLFLGVTAGAVFFAMVAGRGILALFGPATPLPGVDPLSAEGSAKVLGYLLPQGFFLLLGLVQAAWAAVNAVGLVLGWQWAPRSAFAQWLSLLFCGCIPLSAYGLWSLSRPGFWTPTAPRG